MQSNKSFYRLRLTLLLNNLSLFNSINAGLLSIRRSCDMNYFACLFEIKLVQFIDFIKINRNKRIINPIVRISTSFWNFFSLSPSGYFCSHCPLWRQRVVGDDLRYIPSKKIIFHYLHVRMAFTNYKPAICYYIYILIVYICSPWESELD